MKTLITIIALLFTASAFSQNYACTITRTNSSDEVITTTNFTHEKNTWDEVNVDDFIVGFQTFHDGNGLYAHIWLKQYGEEVMKASFFPKGGDVDPYKQLRINFATPEFKGECDCLLK